MRDSRKAIGGLSKTAAPGGCRIASLRRRRPGARSWPASWPGAVPAPEGATPPEDTMRTRHVVPLAGAVAVAVLLSPHAAVAVCSSDSLFAPYTLYSVGGSPFTLLTT